MSSWSEEDKHALSVAHLDVLTYAEAFYLYYDTLRARSRWLRVPIISLSAVTSGASFAFATFPSRWQVYFQVGVGVASLIVTILSGMEGYFRLAALTNQTEKTIIELASLSQETYATTRMKDTERGPPGDTIKSVYLKLSTILNGSAIVPAEFIDKHFDKLSRGVVSMLFAKNESLATLKRQVDEAMFKGETDPTDVLMQLRQSRMPKLQQWALHRMQDKRTGRQVKSMMEELTQLKDELHRTTTLGVLSPTSAISTGSQTPPMQPSLTPVPEEEPVSHHIVPISPSVDMPRLRTSIYHGGISK